MTVITTVNDDDHANFLVLAGANIASSLGEPHCIVHVTDTDEVDPEVVPNSIASRVLSDEQQFTVRGAYGNPAEEILAVAEEMDAEYLVVGGRKRSAVGKAIFGSVTQSVLLDSPCPVLVVPKSELADSESMRGPIVAAVDSSDRSKLVVNGAKRLADAMGNEVHVLHIIATKDWVSLHRDRLERTVTEGVDKEEIEARAQTVASEIANQFAKDTTPVGLVNDPSTGILNYARNSNASYIVLAGRKQTPVGKVLFGSVTQSVLLGSDRPALVMMGEK